MNDIVKHAQHLSAEIGPRRPTSANESAAADYCFDYLRQCGLEPRVEPFRGLASFGHTYIPITTASFASALLATRKRTSKSAGLFLAATGAALALGEITGRWRGLSHRIASAPSQNIVAVIRPKGEVLRQVVIVAHVDSSRSGIPFHPRLAKDFRRSSLTALGAALGTVFLWWLPSPLRRFLGWLSSLVLGSSVLGLIDREVRGKDVDGANDNASGVAVALGMAELLSSQPLENTEVWIALTGCEESDLVGMNAFVARHGRDMQEAFFIGLDSVGGRGTSVVWIKDSGLAERLVADRFLCEVASEVARHNPQLGAREAMWRSAGLDSDVANRAGFPAMSIMALTSEGMIPNWHWPTDTYDRLDEDAVKRCFEFTNLIIQRLDSRA